MSSDPHENRYRRLAIVIASRCLAAIIAFSFLATLLPAGTAAAKSIMACCKGQAAGHCHVNLKTKKSTSISSPCASNCCGHSTAAQQQKHERPTAAPPAKQISFPTAFAAAENVSCAFASNDASGLIAPRGPPTFLVS